MKSQLILLVTVYYLAGCSDDAAAPATTSEPAVQTTESEPEAKAPEKKADKKAAVKKDPVEEEPVVEEKAFKLTADDCTDPDLAKVEAGVTFMLCDGTIGTGTYQPPVIPTPPDLTNLVAGNIKQGIVINGVTGSYSGVGHDLANLLAGNIKDGVTIDGVTGTYDNRPADCGSNGAVGCVTTSAYKAADLTNLSAANVKKDAVVAGVTGTYDNRPSTCSSNGQTGCVTDSTYKAADLTNLSVGNIKSGVAIAGVTGQYPSATYKLAGADNTADLDTAHFDAMMKDATDFEWFDAEGNRYARGGDADLATTSNLKDGVTIFGMTGDFTGTPIEPNAKDLRAGVTVGSTTGTLKTACRNGSRLALYDAPYPPNNTATGGAANSTVNWWDTLDDYNNAFGSLPSSYNSVIWSADNICNGTDFTVTSYTNGTNYAYKDEISGLTWSWEQTPSTGTMDWATAVADCMATFGPSGTANQWRLPTQKELMEAYNHGLSRLSESSSSTHPIYGGHENSFFWTATSKSDALTSAWTVNPATGEVKAQAKTTGLHVLCVK